MTNLQLSFLTLWLMAQTVLVVLALWRCGKALDMLYEVKSELYRIRKRVG